MDITSQQWTETLRPSQIIAWLIVLFFTYAAIVGVNLYSGFRQFRDGRGSLLRYASVTVVLSVFSLAPAIVALIIAAFVNVEDRLVLPAIAATVLCAMGLARFLGSPGYWKLTGKSLDEVWDPEFLQRVRELSDRIGVPMPVVRLLPSMTGDMVAHAAAGGLPAPSLVVSDGILHRLSPDERDAVVAHELAHIRNHSLWWLAAVAPVAGIAAVAAGLVLDPGTSVLFGLALYVGLFRIISRRLELDCDRRAALANGYATTFSALAKIHAISPLLNTGLRSLLLYATATHPSRDERLAVLARHIDPPPAESPDWSQRTASHRRIAFGIATLVWLIILGSCLAGGRHMTGNWWPFLALLATVAAPFAFQIWAIRPEVKRLQRRQQSQTSKMGCGTWLVFLVAMTLAVGYFQHESEFGEFIQATLPHGQEFVGLFLLSTLLFAGAFLVLWILPRADGVKRLELEIATLLQQHQWQRAVEYGDQNKRRAERSPAARHNIAFAHYKLGRWDEAVAQLQQLRLTAPALKQTWITLALISFEQDRPERALEFARELQRADRRDPAGSYLASRALRELGRLDEAAQDLAQARSLSPDDPAGLAGEAMLRLARREVAAAKELIPELERRAPGDATICFIEAEIAFAEQDLNAAREHLGRAARLIAANPFTMCEQRLARLQARLQRDRPHDPLEITEWIEAPEIDSDSRADYTTDAAHG